MHSKTSTFLTAINGGSEDKYFKKFLLTISFSVLGGFVGYKLFSQYQNIFKKKNKIKFIQEITLKCYNRKKNYNLEVRKSYYL